ncbi:MAG TPA: hypothetical protein VL614_20895 [Acetobacteraceae bacterium]|jgi:hypothetical protein|nr:hypothetical protein [Acetobacteraceae bacterium]
MDFDPFQLAVKRAQQAIGEKEWRALKFSEQSAAIYRELQSIDAELVARQPFQEEACFETPSTADPLSLRRIHPVTKPRRRVDSEAA